MKRNSTLGITQLELMISLIIMVMIAVLLANAMNFNRQSLQRAQIMSVGTEAALTRQAVRRWIEDIPLDYDGNPARSYFEGTRQMLQFKSHVTDQSMRAGVPTSLTLTVQADSLDISARGTHPTEDRPHQFVNNLSQDVADMRLSYFGRVSGEADARWHLAWADNIYLPDLVKIEWATSDGTPVPPLTAQPGRTERQSVMSLSSLVPPR